MGYSFGNGYVDHGVSYNWSDYKDIFYVRDIYGLNGKEVAKMIEEALKELLEKYGATPGMESRVDYYGAWKKSVPMLVGMNVNSRGDTWDLGIIKEIEGDRVRVEWENVNNHKSNNQLISWVPMSDVDRATAYGSLDRHVRFADILVNLLTSALEYPADVWNGD